MIMYFIGCVIAFSVLHAINLNPRFEIKISLPVGLIISALSWVGIFGIVFVGFSTLLSEIISDTDIDKWFQGEK